MNIFWTPVRFVSKDRWLIAVVSGIMLIGRRRLLTRNNGDIGMLSENFSRILIDFWRNWREVMVGGVFFDVRLRGWNKWHKAVFVVFTPRLLVLSDGWWLIAVTSHIYRIRAFGDRNMWDVIVSSWNFLGVASTFRDQWLVIMMWEAPLLTRFHRNNSRNVIMPIKICLCPVFSSDDRRDITVLSVISFFVILICSWQNRDIFMLSLNHSALFWYHRNHRLIIMTRKIIFVSWFYW